MRLRRETYLEQIRPYYDSDIIKVITGVRRCGKSILLDTIREELLEKGVSGNQKPDCRQGKVLYFIG